MLRASVTVASFLGFSLSLPQQAQKPHILHILADDYGWANVGYHREADDKEVRTPNIDALVRGGVELDRFYVYQYCSPSRSAIQTGRNPIHVNVQNVGPESSNANDPDGGWQGIPVNMTGVASLMRKGGYRTHMVGKWDVGMATAAHHPRARGYESWLGYWHHANDYWQHTVDTCGLKKMKDLWRYDADHDGPAVDLANGPNCHQGNQNPAGETCVYEEKALADGVKEVISAHDSSQPLFLFWSMHLVHYPLQVPDSYLQKFAFIKQEKRQHMMAMVSYMDDEVGEVVSLLKARGMWENMLVVFHSDNGGEIIFDAQCGGNNYPLRGGKFSNFEGGVRVNAFVAGGALPPVRRNAKLEGFATGWDWYATYAALAGVDPTDHQAAAAGLPAHDSLNLWPWLSGERASSPRDEVVLGETTALSPNGDGQTVVGGIIRGRYKLLVGTDVVKWNTNLKKHVIPQDMITGPNWPNRTISLNPMLLTRHCGRTPDVGCLFDIFEDPNEYTSIATENTTLFQEMLTRMDEVQTTVYSPVRGSKDAAACHAAKTLYGGYWGPWIGSESSAASPASLIV